MPPTEPDLRMTNLPDVPYRSDTLKSNLERVAQAVAPPAVRGVREVARLTDWKNERVRTASYCAAYFVAWAFGYAVAAVGAFVIVLLCFPRTRRYLFPPVR